MPKSSLSVTQLFDFHASSYHENAQVQKQVAHSFEQWLGRQFSTRPDTIVEIGCGTGFLTHELQKSYRRAFITATDSAPNMLQFCNEQFNQNQRIQFTHWDANLPYQGSPANWLVSSMCLQWLPNLTMLIKAWQSHFDLIAFSLLLEGSFSVWRDAHKRCHVPLGLFTCPNFSSLKQTCEYLCTENNWHLTVHQKTFWENFDNGLAFIKNLRSIGATTPSKSYQPINLRPVLKTLAHSCRINHEIGFFCLQKSPHP